MLKKKSNKHGLIATDKLIIIILVALVIVSVLIFIFKADVLKYLRNLPDYHISEEDDIYLTDLSSDKINSLDKKVLEAVVQRSCEDYVEFINEESEKAEIDPLLTLSIIIQESKCDKESVSDSGCIGLMQICSWGVCKDDFGLTEDNWKIILKDPKKNIACGLKILKEKYRAFGEKVTEKELLSCEDCCHNDNLIKKYITYTGDKKAVRGYVGWGCKHPNYVEEVYEKYAKLEGTELV